jgi:hypothetical protein
MSQYLTAGAFILGLMLGAQANGWRLNSQIAALESGIQVAENAALVRQAEAVAERDAELRVIISRERQAVEAARRRMEVISDERNKIQRQFARAMEDPDCAAWADVSIACPIVMHNDQDDNRTGGSAWPDTVQVITRRAVN